MELVLVWSIPRMALSIRSRPYLSWLLPSSEAAPTGPPSLHRWAARGELPLISRLVAGKAWHFVGFLLPLCQAVVWTATWTEPLGHAGFKHPDSRQRSMAWEKVEVSRPLPSHWGILGHNAEERILGLRSEQISSSKKGRRWRGWRWPDRHPTGQLAFQGPERTTHLPRWFIALICNSTPWIKGVGLETDQLTFEIHPQFKK